MPIKLGNTNIKYIMIGDTKIKKVYKGSTLIYPQLIKLNFDYWSQIQQEGWSYTNTRNNGLLVNSGYLMAKSGYDNDNWGYIEKNLREGGTYIVRLYARNESWGGAHIYLINGNEYFGVNFSYYASSSYPGNGVQIRKYINGTSSSVYTYKQTTNQLTPGWYKAKIEVLPSKYKAYLLDDNDNVLGVGEILKTEKTFNKIRIQRSQGYNNQNYYKIDYVEEYIN